MTYIMQEYDDALQKILKNGIRKSNRTGVDTLSIFGMQTRYKIDQYFPILTKRKIFYKSIFAELIWMLSGSTNINDLEALGSKIWSPWKDSEFEKKNVYADGELGPIYGWQLRNFGIDYKHRNTIKYSFSRKENGTILNHNNEACGLDQISYMIHELKNNKNSRRILFNMWDASVVTTDKVRLPPCHYTFQLSVDNNDNLSGMLTQRSCDVPVGSCANIEFYSALIYMFAQQANLNPCELIYSMADAHIYVNQIDAVEEYLSRKEIDSPKLELIKAESMFDYKVDNFIIKDYNPHPAIKMPVAV